MPKEESGNIPASQAEAALPLSILGPEPDSEFHDLAELAAAICSTPAAFISLMDSQFIYRKGAVGLGLGLEATERGGAFCDYTVQQDGLFVVHDAEKDPRFANSRHVAGEFPIRFYAGFPLHGPTGNKAGTLCVVDSVDRELKGWQTDALSKLARQVNALLELRMRRKVFERTLSTIEGEADLFTAFADGVPFACYLKDSAHRLLYYNRPLADRFRITRGEWLGKTSHQLWPKEQADRIRQSEQQVFMTGRKGKLEVQVSWDGVASTSCMLYQMPYRSALGEGLLAVLAVEANGEPRASGSEVDTETAGPEST